MNLVQTLLLQFTMRCTCVHALLLQFMVRCTCDKHALLLQFMVRCTCVKFVLVHITTSVHGEVYMWCLTNFITCSSPWTEVHVSLLLQFMVRCTCDKVCPGSYITTSVHGEVYMHVHALLLQFMVRCTCVHMYYFSSWWGVHVSGQTLSHYYFSSWWGVHVMNVYSLYTFMVTV